MKVSYSKTEYICVNEREARLHGVEIKKVKLFRAIGFEVKR